MPAIVLPVQGSGLSPGNAMHWINRDDGWKLEDSPSRPRLPRARVIKPCPGRLPAGMVAWFISTAVVALLVFAAAGRWWVR